MTDIKRHFEALTRLLSKHPRLIAIGAFLTLSIIYVLRTWFSTRSDFHAYYTAAEKVIQGLSPYDLSDGTPFKYLPLASFFFVPFAFFTYKIALLVFICVLLLCTFFIYLETERSYGWGAVGLLAICLFRFHNQDFSNHQVNSILILLFLYFLKNRGTETLILAALAFTLLASFKLTPLLLLWPLFWMYKWRELALISIFLVVFNFIPIFFFENKALVYQDWWNLISMTTERPAPTAANVQSYSSLLWYGLGDFLGEGGFRNSIYVLYGIILGAIAYGARKAKTREAEARILCASLAFSIMLSPLAWKHSYLQLFPLLLVWFEERRISRLWIFMGLTSVVPALIALISKEAADRSYILVLATSFFAFKSLFEGENGSKVTD